MIQMFCNKCGNNLPDNAKFCERCGAPQIRSDSSCTPSQRDETHKVESKSSNQLKYVIVGIIVLVIIAIVVLYYVQLGAEYFTTQKGQETVYKGTTPQFPVTQRAQETVYKSVEQSTSNIQMIGNVYGLASNPSSGIDEIKFSIGLTPGTQSVDLSRMKIVFSTPTTSPQILVWGNTQDTGHFTAKSNGVNSKVQEMSAQTQIEIDFKVTAVPTNTKMNIELRPTIGASLPFSKTTPATIQKTNVLY
jgi:archaeal flagellin FlaB